MATLLLNIYENVSVVFMFLWMRLNILTVAKKKSASHLSPEAPASPSDLPTHIPHFTPPSAPLWTLCLSLRLRLIKVTFLPLTLLPFNSLATFWGGLAPVAKSVCPSYSLPLLSFFCMHTASPAETNQSPSSIPLLHLSMLLIVTLEAIKAVNTVNKDMTSAT